MHPHEDEQTTFPAPESGPEPSVGTRSARRRAADGRRHGRRRRARRGAAPVVLAGVAVAAVAAAGTFLLSSGDASEDQAPAADSVRHSPAQALATPASSRPTATPSAEAPSSKTKRKPRARTSAAPSATPRKDSADRRPGGTRDAGTGPAAGSRTGRPASPPPATPRGGPAAGQGGSYAQRLLTLVNSERAKAGCSPLRLDPRVQAAAQAHADDMAARDYYDHASPEGEHADSRLRAAGYPAGKWGENIHRGPKDPASAMRDWMNSPGHRANILDCGFKDFGAGVDMSANGPWWVQNFGTRG
ncbi:CAP domain-containing protein [Streptomyces palmae]|uniref:SCP domain-containing protein n=1 Tax=Streptomyces palmae TaxID=1701085 RepID=A0A4Z0GV29_9ACTN|nr:CAP domain-containing protein [Streptomyces palmae]TGB01540.1 hypothetical protein E4099_21080 [Streptomyces palmae]